MKVKKNGYINKIKFSDRNERKIRQIEYSLLSSKGVKEGRGKEQKLTLE